MSGIKSKIMHARKTKMTENKEKRKQKHIPGVGVINKISK